jgi:ketosteroid isomerase-like protein
MAGENALIDGDDPLAVAATTAVQSGDLAVLDGLLAEHPELATARIGDETCSRTLLHAATDWPGNFPNGPVVVARLVAAGADVDARFVGGHTETPLHWAASSNDVGVLDALLDAGSDIEAPGAVLGGGSPLADACGFGNWDAARRLVERGARTRLKDAAALGLVDRVAAALEGDSQPDGDEITAALWSACYGGQRAAAEFLLGRGADVNWVGWDGLSPLDVAVRSGNEDVVELIRERGGRTAEDLVQLDVRVASIRVVVAWLDAMRRGDRDALGELFAVDATWHGLPPDAMCGDRDEIVAMLAEQFAGHWRVEAIELIAGTNGVALGVRDVTITEIGGVAVDGQLYNVFIVADGRISAVRDFARRGDALAAAGAPPPNWR